jgi:16S rRNA processing protein RimM
MFIIGKVVKPQGIKGEIKAEIITSFPEHFEHLVTIYIKRDDFVKLALENSRLSGNFVFLKFRGFNSRNDAENLRDNYLYIPDEELIPLENDEYYHHQLIGLNVYDQDDSFLGIVKDIESYPSNDILNIESKDKKTYLIPVVKDFIKKVDIKSQKVVVHVVEGLLG